MTPRRPLNQGFTLIEVLTTIGVISVVLGLALPTLMAARGAAWRLSCANHLRQLGVALNAYISEHGSLPSVGVHSAKGRSSALVSTQTALLPHLDQSTVYHQINFALEATHWGVIHPGHATTLSTSVGVFVCPADGLAARRSGSLNYRVNRGLIHNMVGSEQGAQSGQWRHLSPAAFTDGFSNTLAFSEKPVGTAGATPSSFRDWRVYPGEVPEPGTPPDWIAACARLRPQAEYRGDAGRSWLLLGLIYSAFLTSAPPNSPVPDCGRASLNGVGLFTARGFHGDGVNACFVDGSVRWYGAGTSTSLWQAIGTRSGAEVLDSDRAAN